MDAKDGAHTAVSAMHASEVSIDDIFRVLAAYVNRIAAGDETQILSSGFHLKDRKFKHTSQFIFGDHAQNLTHFHPGMLIEYS
jgi:hypothetical protein